MPAWPGTCLPVRARGRCSAPSRGSTATKASFLSSPIVSGSVECLPADDCPCLSTVDTGDNLHFGLARLMAHSAGNKNVELVVVGDDVSVPKSRGKMVGRRCLAGITLGK